MSHLDVKKINCTTYPCLIKHLIATEYKVEPHAI